ncbi:MAG: serine/threonine protein kinase, partial [Deltaproteobacteria bacterium]|nr:serine/threonine protein kinase [Kofleriaceae bacterium]
MTAAAAEELPGELGEFAIERELGRGGSGVVYAATWHGRSIALKVLRPDEAATPKERDRFLGEARILARVQHPGVVRVHASGVLPDGRPYLAMERLSGGALAERLLMGRMAVGQALGLFEQLASAVAALHAAGIVHRDIKPENIMLVDGGHRAVLLDFGIARGVDDAASTTTQMGLQRGTPAYMAPERFFGARATIGSDVYETAVVLFVMLTGHLPWRDPRSPQDRLEPRTPSALGVELPAGLERELMRALAPKPEGRPASIEELASAVRMHAWEGDTVRAHQPPTHPTAAAAVGATTQRVRRPIVVGG